MARRTRRPPPTAEVTLVPVSVTCPACGNRLYSDYSNFRTLTSLAAVTRYTLRISRCRHRPCDLFRVPFRPEAEGRLALPHHELALDVLARVGRLRYCSAVRSALTDDGRPPLSASGLKLHDRLYAISASLKRVAGKRSSRRS